MNRIPIHAFVYGESGTGKSTFACTWPKPIRVFFFDPFGKDVSYIIACLNAKGTVGELQHYESMVYRDLQFPDGIVRLDYYHDLDSEHPDAFSRFKTALDSFCVNEVSEYKTVVVDSATHVELAARYREKKVINPGTKDSRQWWAGSTDAMESVFVQQFAGLPINVLLILHVDERSNIVSGEILRGPSAPGRLSKQNRLGAAYQEQYRSYRIRDDEGDLHYILQTQNRDGFQATSPIGALDPCYPHYESLWEEWDKR